MGIVKIENLSETANFIIGTRFEFNGIKAEIKLMTQGCTDCVFLKSNPMHCQFEACVNNSPMRVFSKFYENKISEAHLATLVDSWRIDKLHGSSVFVKKHHGDNNYYLQFHGFFITKDLYFTHEFYSAAATFATAIEAANFYFANKGNLKFE